MKLFSKNICRDMYCQLYIERFENVYLDNLKTETYKCVITSNIFGHFIICIVCLSLSMFKKEENK